jgi:hypothetical protein
MTETLPRVKFRQPDTSIDAERCRLAKQAQSVLGYSKLAMALMASDGGLLAGLKRLGIEPLITSRVEAYKAKKARPGMWSGHKEAISLMPVLALLTCFVIPRVSSRVSWDIPNLGCFGLVGLVAISVILTSRICHRFWSDTGSRTIFFWDRTALSDYFGSVPEFVLAKALAIKAEVPGVRFYVEQLHRATEQSARPLPDPFLIAEFGENGMTVRTHRGTHIADTVPTESYYIEVWDEKEYEATL